MSTAGPFCSAPGCVQTAATVVLFAGEDVGRVYLCDDCQRPLRRVLLDVWTQRRTAIAPDRVAVGQPDRIAV